MQDRSPPTRRNPLATHGRTIHRVKTGKPQNEQMFSGLPLIADVRRMGRYVRSVPGTDIVGLLDDLVGAGEQSRRYCKTKRRCGFQIKNHCVPGRRLHRQLGRLRAAQDAVHIGRRLPI